MRRPRPIGRGRRRRRWRRPASDDRRAQSESEARSYFLLLLVVRRHRRRRQVSLCARRESIPPGRTLSMNAGRRHSHGPRDGRPGLGRPRAPSAATAAEPRHVDPGDAAVNGPPACSLVGSHSHARDIGFHEKSLTSRAVLESPDGLRDRIVRGDPQPHDGNAEQTDRASLDLDHAIEPGARSKGKKYRKR